MQQAHKKLADKFIGLFEVEQQISTNTYRLKLLEEYKRIHPTFHVSLLEPYCL